MIIFFSAAINRIIAFLKKIRQEVMLFSYSAQRDCRPYDYRLSQKKVKTSLTPTEMHINIFSKGRAFFNLFPWSSTCLSIKQTVG